jgi:HPt (histidine-containing phosphotransfer) domain-containing protein
MNKQLLTEGGINVEEGIQYLGDESTYNEFLDKFLTESETRIPDIKRFKEALDLPNFVILVHAMKSDSRYLGFTKLAELSLQHEMAGKEHNITLINEHFDELMNEANRIILLVKEYLGKA